VGRLMFRCSASGREFDSGFTADSADLSGISPVAKMNVQCRVCYETHQFTISEGRINQTPAAVTRRPGLLQEEPHMA